jgi:hypothetical protein
VSKLDELDREYNEEYPTDWPESALEMVGLQAERITELEAEFPGGDAYLYHNKVCHCVTDLDKIKELEAELEPLRKLAEMVDLLDYPNIVMSDSLHKAGEIVLLGQWQKIANLARKWRERK